MKNKKSKNADIDRYRIIFFQVGLSISLLLVIWAFGLKAGQKSNFTPPDKEFDVVTELPAPRTALEEKKEEEKKEERKEGTEFNPVDKVPEKKKEKEPEPIEDKGPKEIYLPDEDSVEIISELELWEPMERTPEFPGGESALIKYFSENIRYPQNELEFDMEGVVLVNFTVDENGDIINVFVDHETSKGFEKEAIRLISEMPRWMPARQRDKKVRVKMSLPIRFRIIE